MNDDKIDNSCINGVPPTITTDTPEINSHAMNGKTGNDNDDRPSRFPSPSCQYSEKSEHAPKASSDSTSSTCGSTYRDQSQHNSDDDEADTSYNSDSEGSADSTRRLLRLAENRIRRQSVYEEVRHLRTLIEGHETHSGLLLRQKSSLLVKCNDMENLHESSMREIHRLKMMEIRYKEEQAEREKVYMNEMNDVCRSYEEREQEYMGQLMERDRVIVDLQNRLNEMEVSTRRARLKEEGRDVCNAVSAMETEMRLRGLDNGKDESDDSSCDYV